MEERIEGFRLSPQQRRLWHLWPQSPNAFRAQCAVSLEGPLCPERLSASLEEVVARHEILRTTLWRRRGVKVPLQVVSDVAALSWRSADLRGLALEKQSAAVRGLLCGELGQDLDPGEPGPLRAVLAFLGPERSLLALTLPALHADSWTLGNLVKELRDAYAALLAEEPFGGEEPLQYPQFSEWQHELLAEDGEDGEGRAYWRELAAALGSSPRLPHERAASGHHVRAEAVSVPLPAEAITLAEALAESCGLSVTTVWLACWQVLLTSLSGRSKIPIVTLLANRDHEDLRGTMGPLAKAVPIRGRIETEDTLVTILERTRVALEEASDWLCTFVPEVGDADVEDLRELPVGFEAVEWPEVPPVENLSFSLFSHTVGMERLKLQLSCLRIGTEWRLQLGHDNRVIPAADAWLLSGRLAALITRAVRQPRVAVADLDLVGEGERQLLLGDLAGAAAAADATVCTPVHRLIWEQAARTPGAVAAVWGESRLMYGEMQQRADRLAQRIRHAGISRGSLVGVCLDRSPELLIALLGILEAGGAYVALDPNAPADRLQRIAADASLQVVLTDRHSAARFSDGIATLCLDASEPGDGDNIPAEEGPEVSPDDLAYVLYTSGSTGAPKGVMVTHRGLTRYLTWAVETYGMAGGSGAPVHSPVSFDLTVTSLLGPLLAGRTAFLLPEGAGVEALAEALQTRSGFSLVKLTPAHLEVLAQTVPAGAAAGTAALVIGGEALSWERLTFWRCEAPATRLINEYGPTETVVGCCAYEAPLDAPVSGPVPIGRPIATARVYVLDAALRLVPFGVAGELCVGGPGVARGYLGAPSLTAERFIPDPCDAELGGRLYRTGDLVRFLPSGDLEFLGRIDHQVKIRGVRIEPAEVESALRRHSGVAAAVVVASGPEGMRELVAYVVARRPLSAPELRSYLAELLPEVMIPALFSFLDELPLNRHGKVDRARLPEPSHKGRSAMGRYIAPRNPAEGRMVGIWEEVLHRRGIGVGDSFFDVGGDSIRAVRLVSRINVEFGANLQMPDIFAHQSIEALMPVLVESSSRASLDEERRAGLREIERWRQSILADARQASALAGAEDFLPLSGIEKGMAYYSLLLPDEPIYHDQFAYMLDIADPERFFDAFDALVRRHPILRSRFHLYTFQEPVKVVLPPERMERAVEDLTDHPVAEQIQRINAWRDADLARKLTFDGAPLWRLRLFRLRGALFCVLWSWHHAILDGWSNHSFWVELSELYQTSDPAVAPLPPLASGYGDYLAVTLGRKASPETETFWRELLAGAGRNRLPFNRSKARPLGGGHGMRTRELPVPGELLGRLRLRALESQVSMQSLFLGAHLWLMHILSGERDVVTGLVSHERPSMPDGDKVLGCYLNTVPVRVGVDRCATCRELLQTLHALRGQMRAHEIPLVDIAALFGARDTGDNPLFDTLFNFMDFHVVKEVEGSALFAPMLSEELRREYPFESREMTNTLFDVEVSTTLDNLLLRLKYSPWLFAEPEIETALRLFSSILERLAEDLDVPLDPEALLSATEREEVLVRFNDTAVAWSRQPALHGGFEEQAARAPARPAVVCSGSRLTYSELDRRANRIAHFLRAHGVRPGDAVGVVCERSVDLAAALLAVLKAGGSYVPMEATYPAARRAYIARTSAVAAVLADRELGEAGALILHLRDVEEGAWPEVRLEVSVDPGDLAYTIYTSGSTGDPKGVMIEHRAAVNLIEWVNREFAVGPDDRLLMLSSVCFDLSVYDFFGGLAAGAAVILPIGDDLRDPARLAHLTAAERITFWSSVPSTMGLLVKHLETWEPEYRQPDLRTVFLSGDWIPVALPDRIRRFFPQARVISLGGATEATVWSNWYPVGAVDPAWASIPYGRPIANNTFYILDDRLSPVPTSVVGGLYIGGLGVARGYAADPVRTATSFLPDRFADVPGARLYRTGDLGRLRPDGHMEFLGRLDQQVKVRGFRIELGEVESQLRRHPRVREAAVIDRLDSANERFLCGYVVAAGELEPGELRSFLAAALPEHMIPTSWMLLPELPLTPNGKLDRRALPDPAVAGSSVPLEQAPVGATETALAAIWEEILGVRGVGTCTHFFDLGGHSLSAVQVVSRIRHRFGCEISFRQFFEAGTIAALAELLDRAAVAGPAPGPERRPGPPVLSFAQERMWFLQQLDPGSPAFNLGGAVRLRGALDSAAFAASLDTLVARHEALRTGVAAGDGLPLPVVAAAVRQPLPRIDLDGLPRSFREPELLRLAEEELHRPFDLARPPLLRTTLVRLAESEHVALFVFHHIAGDGWSVGIITREIGELYAAFSAGCPASLPELPICYSDYARWQRKVLTGARLEGQLAFWRQHLSGPLLALDLPGRAQRPEVPRFRGAVEPVHVPRPTVDALADLAREENATLFMVLLAALDTLLHHYSGQTDLVVGTNVANRDRPEIEGLIGFFVNNLALRMDLSGNPSFRVLVRRVREVALQAFAHQEVPFEQVLRHVQPQRYASYASLFQVMFVLQSFQTGAREFPRLVVEPLELPSRVANFDLTLVLTESEEGLAGALIYDTDLFAAESMGLMAEHFRTLLERGAADPDRDLAGIEIAAGVEVQNLASTFSEDF